MYATRLFPNRLFPGRLYPHVGATAVVPVVVPLDLLDAIETFINDDAAIGALLSRTLPDDPKHRIASSWPQDELPFIVLTAVDGAGSYESPNSGPTALGEVLANCWAIRRRDAVALADLITERMTDANLRWTNGSCASFRRTNPFQAAVRDPRPWRGGQHAWGVMVRFRALMG